MLRPAKGWRYRGTVAVRALAGTLGAYAAAALAAYALARTLPLGRVEAVVAATLAALLVFPAVTIWAFLARGPSGWSRVREGVRQTGAWLHGWSGLLLGWVLFVMCLAGTLSVFKPEIGRWMRPETSARANSIEAVASATRWLARNAPNSAGWYLNAPDARMNTVDAVFDKGGKFVLRALDPVTGAPVPRETLGGEFFYRLHFELELPYPWGRLLASAAAMAMLVALITGIIAHRRIFKDFFTFRPRKGQRSWLDGHNAVGVLALPFHLMITFTGLLTLASLTMPWGIAGNYGSDLTRFYADFAPGEVSRAPTGHKVPLAPVAPMLREAERRLGGPIGRVNVASPGDAGAVVTVYRADRGQIAYAAGQVSFDGATGKVLSAWTERRPALQTYGVLYGLHMARFAPVLLRWLYFLGGALLTLAIASGLVLWVVKRREKAPLSLGNRLLERANAGVIAGVPIGCIAFLWANRLLPLGMDGRAEAEVSIALWSAAAALVAGFALKPARAWPVLFGILALGCALAPVLVGPTLFADGFAAGDGALIGGDLLLWTATIAFALLAFASARPKVPARDRRAAVTA